MKQVCSSWVVLHYYTLHPHVCLNCVWTSGVEYSTTWHCSNVGELIITTTCHIMYELTGNDVHNIHICLTIYLSSVPAAQSRYHRRTVQTTVEGTPFFVNHEHGAPGLMICGTLEKHLLTYIIVETLFIAKTYSFNSNCQTAIKQQRWNKQ